MDAIVLEQFWVRCEEHHHYHAVHVPLAETKPHLCSNTQRPWIVFFTACAAYALKNWDGVHVMRLLCFTEVLSVGGIV